MTSCNRIGGGPEGAAGAIVLPLAVEVTSSSAKTLTWPESGEDVPLPGSVRLKFVPAKTTTTGPPLPITSFGLGETIDKVGAGAARTFGAAMPETMSIPTVPRRKARIRAFTLGIPPATVWRPAHNLSAAQDEDDQDKGQEERDSPIGDQRQADGRGRDDVNRHVRDRIGIQRSIVVVHEPRSDCDVPLRQRHEEDRLRLNHLHHDVALDQQLHVTFVRGVRLASRFHQREILDSVRYVNPVARRFEPRR